MTLNKLKKYVASKVVELHEVEKELKYEISLMPQDDELEEILNEYYDKFELSLLKHIEDIKDRKIIYTNEEDAFHFVSSTQYLMYQWIGIITILKALNKKEQMDFLGNNLECLMFESDKIACKLDVVFKEYEEQAIFFLNDYALKNNIKNEDFNIEYFMKIKE